MSEGLCRRALLLLLLALPLATCCRASGDDGKTPAIEFERVPPYGSTDDLAGRVANVNPDDHKVAVYIFVGGWWTKPYWDRSLVSIAADGRWTCDITTGGVDETATRIAALLLPNGVMPPRMSGQTDLPAELAKNAVASVEVTRLPQVRIISFSGYEWRVKASKGCVGPGPNYFSELAENVWVDEEGRLHLKITSREGKWHCAEVICHKSLGYGRYTFWLSTDVAKLDRQAVLGLFTWDDAPESHHREIDIEFSKWGEADNQNAQFVVQPYSRRGNMHRFDISAGSLLTTHSLDWQKDSVSFQSLRGHRTGPPRDDDVIASWVYTGPDIPGPGNENARINLWLAKGHPSSNGKEVEVVISKFEFVAATAK